MALPEAVRRQKEAAEAAMAEAGNTGVEPAPEPAPTQAAEPVATPEETPVGTPPQAPNEFTPVEIDLSQGAGSDNEVIQNLRGQLQVIKGKYNKELPRLNARIKQLESQNGDTQEVVQLRQQVQDLKSQLESVQATPDTPEPNGALEKVRAEYGDELADLFQGLISNNQQQAKDLEQRIDGVSQKMTREKFDAHVENLRRYLSGQGLDFDLMNDDQAFGDWLVFDDGNGVSRSRSLNQALHNGDIEGAANYFVRFGRLQNQSMNVDFNQHVKVPSTREPDQAAEVLAPSEEVWHEHFYKKARVGSKDGYRTMKEADDMETRLFAAQNALLTQGS